jgi:hypothetical protein
MTGAKAHASVPVKVFMKQQQIPTMGIGLIEAAVTEARTPALSIL